MLFWIIIKHCNAMARSSLCSTRWQRLHILIYWVNRVHASLKLGGAGEESTVTGSLGERDVIHMLFYW